MTSSSSLRDRPSTGASPSAFVLGTFLTLCAGFGALTSTSEGQDGPQQVGVPAVDLGWVLLDIRQGEQRKAAASWEVEHDFALHDRLTESGITFVHRITEDSGRLYDPNHYDHGNGLPVADVDGDGRLDLYFPNQIGPNELWRNVGGGRFENATEGSGAALADRVSAGASFADVDNDGDPDLFVATVHQGNALLINDGSGRFEDRTREAGLALEAHSSSATFFDFDRDGDLDLFLANVGAYTKDELGEGGYRRGLPNAFTGHLLPERTETSVLYRNLGDGRFEDVSAAVGLVDGSWSGDAAVADLDGDLYPEIYVLNMQGDDRLYRNVEGRAVQDVTSGLFPVSPWGSMGARFFDVENDGDLDLYITDMHSDMSRKITPGFEKLKSYMAWPDGVLQGGANNVFGNAFWINRGRGRFEEASDASGLENYWPWGFSVGDLNGDGWQDVFVTASMNYPFRYGINSLLLNDRGRGFLDAELVLGVEPRAVPKIPWFELDCDGRDVEHAECGGRSGRVEVLGNAGSRSSVLFDIEGDGDLDIVTTEFHGRPQVLVSDLADAKSRRALEIELRGTRSNRDGLGARVLVETPTRVQTRHHDGKSGYLTQSSMPLWIALGTEQATRIQVRWPSGIVQTITEGIPSSGLFEIVEPAG